MPLNTGHSISMFTGLIEKKGKITSIRPGAAMRLAVDLEELAGGVEPGDSIAINGACLTVTALAGSVVFFDVVAESLRRTALSDLRPGDRVNIERALRAGDRLGGHFVQGHVDGIGTISGRTTTGGEYLLHISAPRGVTDNMIEKGSVAVDGISLTVASLSDEAFSIALVPHTLKHTTIGDKPDGSRVNIETDMLGKWVKKLLAPRAGQGITKDFLKEHGF